MAVSVVASATGGIPELVEHGVSGLLVSPEDPEALATSLATLWTDRGLQTAMSRQARELFLARFELGSSIRRQADWIEDLIEVELDRGKSNASRGENG